jgi:hypothetical protein
VYGRISQAVLEKRVNGGGIKAAPQPSLRKRMDAVALTASISFIAREDNEAAFFIEFGGEATFFRAY